MRHRAVKRQAMLAIAPRACFWRCETEDVLHPCVINSADKNHALITKAGCCQVKHTFKDRMCNIAVPLQLNDPEPATCMADDKPLAPAVRNGGI